MPDPFESPKYLLSQTRKRITELRLMCEGLLAAHQNANVVDVDPQTGNKTFKLKFTGYLPDEARHIAATAVSDMRHVLDQSLCASVRELTGNDPGLIYFPFTTSPADLNGRLATHAYKVVPDEICALLRSFHPYPTGQGYSDGDDFFSAFGKIAGPNKHQISLGIGGTVAEYNVDSITSDGLISMKIPPGWDISKNEMIIGVTTPDGHIDYNFDVALFVALTNAGAMTGYPIVPTLGQVWVYVHYMAHALEGETLRVLAKRGV